MPGLDCLLRLVYLGIFTTTAYTTQPNSQPLTASGLLAGPGICAAGPALEFGAVLVVEGLGGVCVVADRGGAVGNDNLDIYVADLPAALRWGRQRRAVWRLLSTCNPPLLRPTTTPHRHNLPEH